MTPGERVYLMVAEHPGSTTTELAELLNLGRVDVLVQLVELEILGRVTKSALGLNANGGPDTSRARWFPVTTWRSAA